MAIVKYIECDICGKKITEMHKKIRGIYSFGICTEHICWGCWGKIKEFIEQKKKEKQQETNEE